jgi:hypothetical protein
MSDFDFNPDDYEPQSDSAVLPAGDYAAAIVHSEIKSNKAGTGRYLNLSLEILDGEHAGRRVWDLLNLWNTNTQAQDIARRTLKSITVAVDRPGTSNACELHGLPIGIRLGIEPAQNGYEAKNKVKKYFPIDGQATQMAPAPAPTAPATPAWRTK